MKNASSWIRIATVPLVIAATATPIRADSCRRLALDSARRAAALAERAEARMGFDLLRPTPLRSVTVREHEGGAAELLLDGEAVDLRETFVRERGADWLALGSAVAGCSSGVVPARVAGEPFATLPAEELARLRAPAAPQWFALAELPSVLPQWDERPGAPVAARAAPRDDAAVVEILERGGELPTDEWSYEQVGAIVLAERDAWVRIRLAAGSGWIRRAEAEPIHPLADLVVDGLSYLTAGWDGLLYPVPGERAGALVLDAGWRRRLFRPDEVPIDALERRTIDGAVWLRVRVTSRHCADSEEHHVWAEGWVPLAGRDGEPAVGFYSRGC